MKGEQRTIPFEEFASNLETIFDQVKEHGEEITVEHEGELYVLRSKSRRRGRKMQRMTREDPMWDIVGIASSGEPGNTVGSNKYLYVAEAISAHVEPHPQQEDLLHNHAHEGQQTSATSDDAQ